MKKNAKNAVTNTETPAVETKTPIAKAKNTLVRPRSLYTKDEVRSFLGLSKGTSLSPKHYPGMGGRKGAKISGSAIIAKLERSTSVKRGRPSRVKIGRRYASGTVSVVAR